MNLMGADFETLHEFKAGDTISAEMMNELFSFKDLRKRYFFSRPSWNMENTNTTNVANNMTGGTSNDANGMTKSRTDIVTFTDDGDGTYSWSQTNYSSFLRFCGSSTNNCSAAGNGHYSVIYGIALFEDTANNANDYGKWLIIGKEKIKLLWFKVSKQIVKIYI